MANEEQFAFKRLVNHGAGQTMDGQVAQPWVKVAVRLDEAA